MSWSHRGWACWAVLLKIGQCSRGKHQGKGIRVSPKDVKCRQWRKAYRRRFRKMMQLCKESASRPFQRELFLGLELEDQPNFSWLNLLWVGVCLLPCFSSLDKLKNRLFPMFPVAEIRQVGSLSYIHTIRMSWVNGLLALGVGCSAKNVNIHLFLIQFWAELILSQTKL